MKNFHEVRDPIHVFVRFDSDERRVIDSRPFQRLRHIHQLALSPLVYPGATHKRFEHSLGVMELAGRVFDVVTLPDNLTDEVRDVLREITQPDKLVYWRRVLRMAALCHDIGHLPFSHAAENELLPSGWSHERLTQELILSEEMQQIWQNMIPPLKAEHIVKLAIGKPKGKNLQFSNWEAILSEIIVGDAFGVDRMDYLLRDSYHAGVPYGRFDHYRLIDTLRILPSSPIDEVETTKEPVLGTEEGGIHTAEALLLARYFMYSQVYYHPVRLIYDIHLTDFLRTWLTGGRFSTDTNEHLKLTDNEVWAALLETNRNESGEGFVHSQRILNRQHFRVLYSRNPTDEKINQEAAANVFESAKQKLGEEYVRYKKYSQRSGTLEFPVKTNDGRIASSMHVSETLSKIPVAKFEYVFVSNDLIGEAKEWLEAERERIIQSLEENENE